MGKRRRGKKRKNQDSVQEPIKAAGSSQESSTEVLEEGLSQRGKKTILVGAVLLIVGFYVLSLTDSEGRNWASHLSPLLILGAYAVIGAGIMLPDTETAPDTPSDPPEKTV